LACALTLGLGCQAASPRPTPDEVAAPPPPAAKSEPAKAAPTDPERADKLRDLNTLCAALNDDYVDGTLSDYFKGVKVETDWGREVMKAGADADRPGRFLEEKIDSLSPKAEDATLSACRELLDYIDEVE
jgi:hypothetical protein